MRRIKKLPEHLINKIAAGEVVERPASVVKELVENALDAEARTVSVDLRDGGAALIRVSDDGIGMTAEELGLALERHATSKIAADADLDAIATLGFRGEALPAICAVARFVITSRARGVADGTRLAGAGGEIAQRLAVAADTGTTIEVTDLFFNTPARLKFLKAVTTELAQSLRPVTQLALAHLVVHLRVTSNGRSVLNAPPAKELRDRVGALWGWDVAGRLLAIDRHEHAISVRGLASPPDLTRGGRDDVITLVNGRPVRDPALFQAVLQAYRPLLPRDRFPFVVLSVTLPHTDVDVNVHPTKAWVRFRHPRLVHEMIGAALGEALRRRAVVPGVASVSDAPTSTLAIGAHSGAVEAGSTFGGDAGQAALFAEPTATYATSLGRVLGQVQDTFIVAASDTEVFFLDQHAAHERVIFERLQREANAGTPVSQALLFGEPLDLAPGAGAQLGRWRAPLERLGFAFDERGDSVVLRAVPVVLKGEEPRRLMEAMVDELAGPKAGEPVIDRALAFVSCRAAIKANTPLAREEMERLLAELSATATPYFCPHGRPTMSRISLQDVRREVRRIW
ncbi:MAG: DNA mismatch repair endonuclease MutL [Candidatus Rokuibacteriota bacterium]|nr:MAG: DNA mismatch repair endonuclease MutL [Candidatus Rokubacteria bacterium]